MSQPAMDPLAALLYQIAQAEPKPWYPKVFAETRGVPRDSLDPPLERLRLLGLVELTEWVANTGQGYRLTTAGKRVLYEPRLQAQLQAGTLPAANPEPETTPEANWGHRGASALDRGEAIRSGLTSKARPTITYILIGLNVAVFLAGMALVFPDMKKVSSVLMGSGSRIPILTGALTPESILKGEWWRLLTSCFVHFGIVHLGVNMYSLWVLGPLSEKAWGRWRFLALYLIGGLGGSCAMAVSMFTGWELAGVGAGASGAIWGLMTGFGVWVFLNRQALGPNLSSTWLRQIGFIVLLNLFLTFTISHLSKSGHIGGGLFGAVGAVILNEQRFAGGFRRWLATAVAVLLPVLALAAVVVVPKGNVPNPAASSDPYFEDLNEAAGISDQAESQYLQEVVPVLKKAWKDRDATEKARVEKILQAALKDVSAARAALERLGKIDSPLEPARVLLLEYLMEQKVLFEMAGRMLEKGENWTARDAESFRDQQELLEDIGRRYIQAMRSQE